MELDEKDMGLCSFIDPAKKDYGFLSRKNQDKGVTLISLSFYLNH